MTRTACLNAVYELAKKDSRVVFIGSDLSPNTLADFKRDFPERFFMEGIQEQNIIGMAAGLAMEGFIPYVNTIATFITRRCYEQVAIDICAHNLPVRLIGNGGGAVYAPLGPTHCAIEDIAIMRALPNMAVVNCAYPGEMSEFMATTLEGGPMYIRLGRDDDKELVPVKSPDSQIVIVSNGCMLKHANKTAEIIGNCDVINLSKIKPMEPMIDLIKYKHIISMEEGIVNGGLGTALLEITGRRVIRFGFPDAFLKGYGERDDMLDAYGLTPERMAEEIKYAISYR